MKRLYLLAVVLAFFLTACSGPVFQTSPSLNDNTIINPTGNSNLVRGADYAELIQIYQKAMEGSGSRYRMYALAGADRDLMAPQEGSKESNNDYSQTNVQVEGVDEADIIKTDGSYLYLVANNRLYIVDVRDPAVMKILISMEFSTHQEDEKEIRGESPLQMYLDIESQRLVLIVSGWISEKYQEAKPAETTEAVGRAPDEDGLARSAVPYYYYRHKQYTTTRIFDIADKSQPKLVRQFSQTGYYLDSRMVGDSIYVISNDYSYRFYPVAAEGEEAPRPEDIFPAVSSDHGDVKLDSFTTVSAGDIAILPDGDVSNQMVIAGIDLINDRIEPDVKAVLGTSGTIYVSTGFLYVAAYSFNWGFIEPAIRSDNTSAVQEMETEIYRFRLSDGKISEAGKGSVPGYIVNQFSMDEYNGYFRVATTTGNSWEETGENASRNNLYVLDSSLRIVGQVTGLAKGETIKSVRFMGDQAYVVTFRTIDPLFVIDLTKPTEPVVLGELKIPGYSTYLHPYADNMLLGFGYDVKEQNGMAFNAGLKVSMFDISDFSNPREVSTIIFGDRGSWSELLYNHKPLLFSLEKNLIAFPATLFRSPRDNFDSSLPLFQGLLVLEVINGNQLNLRGWVTHFDKLPSPLGNPVQLNDRDNNAFYSFDAIFRGAWVGDNLFTISSRQIRATDLGSLVKIGAVELPGFESIVKYYDVGIDGGREIPPDEGKTEPGNSSGSEGGVTPSETLDAVDPDKPVSDNQPG